jgi:hypothetical protein
MGVSAVCLAYGSQDGLVAAAEDNHIPYVRAVSGPNPQEDPVYGNIHRDVWEVRWTADDAADGINNRIEQHFPSDAATGLIDAGWGELDSGPSHPSLRR